MLEGPKWRRPLAIGGLDMAEGKKISCSSRFAANDMLPSSAEAMASLEVTDSKTDYLCRMIFNGNKLKI